MRFDYYLTEAPTGESKIETLFNRAVKAKDDRIKISILIDVWKFYRDKYFPNMKGGSIRFTKDMTLKHFSQRGHYSPGRNELAFSRRLFLAPFEKFREIFLHEMCHQAVTMISGSRDHHGPIWKKWMVKVGLNPSRVDYDSNETYMTDKEKEVHKEKIAAKEKAIKKEVQVYPADNKPAKWFSPDQKMWIKGLIVCPNDKSGRRWAFISAPYTSTWKIVPSEWFFKMEPEDEKKYTEKEYIDAAEYIRNSTLRKSQHRSEKTMRTKSFKKTYGYLMR